MRNMCYCIYSDLISFVFSSSFLFLSRARRHTRGQALAWSEFAPQTYRNARANSRVGERDARGCVSPSRTSHTPGQDPPVGARSGGGGGGGAACSIFLGGGGSERRCGGEYAGERAQESGGLSRSRGQAGGVEEGERSRGEGNNLRPEGPQVGGELEMEEQGEGRCHAMGGVEGGWTNVGERVGGVWTKLANGEVGVELEEKEMEGMLGDEGVRLLSNFTRLCMLETLAEETLAQERGGMSRSGGGGQGASAAAANAASDRDESAAQVAAREVAT
jgi:hypothetical protein